MAMLKTTALITLGLCLAFGGLLLMPFATQKNLLVEAPKVYINLPCQQALVKASQESNMALDVHVTGHGIGLVTLKESQNEVTLTYFGVLAGLKCTATLYVPKAKTIYLPVSMPFIAQGALPALLADKAQKWRSFTKLSQ